MSPPPAREVEAIFLRVPRREIAYVKFVFESYEGVAMLRTLDRFAATVVVLAVPDLVAQARAIIDALQAEGACEEITRPPGTGDLIDDDGP